MSDEAKKIVLQMLADGKITVEESEKLLSSISAADKSQALPCKNSAKERFEEREREREKNKERNKRQDAEANENKPFTEDFFNTFGAAGKLSFDLKNLAQNIQHTVRDAIKKAEPKSREIKEKMKEFGAWVQDLAGTMAKDILSTKNEEAEGVNVDFTVNINDEVKECDSFTFENIFGGIKLYEGDEFKLRVSGVINGEEINEVKPSRWFYENAVKIDGKALVIAFDSAKKHKALIDLEIFMPSCSAVKCRTVDGPIRIIGNYAVKEIKTVSGNIKIQDAEVEEAVIETVSGSVQIGDSTVDAQITSTSGDIVISDCSPYGLKITSVSGDVLVSEPMVGEDTCIEIVTTSGDTIIEQLDGPWAAINAFSRSGEVSVNWEGCEADSGEKNVWVLKSDYPGGTFQAESVSGNISFN